MGLFEKRKKPSFLETVGVENPVNQQSVLDYLVSLDEDGYKKLIKVAGVYRDADKKANEILGVELVAADINHLTPGTLGEDEAETELDKIVDDELAAAFIETEKPGKTAKAIKVES